MSLITRPVEGGCVLSVRVHPGARRNAMAGIHDGALKISLATPPTDGRANAALVAFLAGRLGIPSSSVALLAGATSRSKTLRITGLTQNEVEEKLLFDLA